MHFSFLSDLLQCSYAAGLYLQRPKQWALLNFCLPQVVLLVGLVVFFLSEYIYISLMNILCVLGNFYFPCSNTENIFSIILLSVGSFTYRLSSSSRSHRNKLLSILTTLDVFINPSFSKDNIQILS